MYRNKVLRVFSGREDLGTNMARGKTKTNMVFLILRRFFCQSFTDMLKIPNISIFYSVSCGPLSHVRSRQKLRSLTSLHMLLDRPVRVFFATSNLRVNTQHPSAGNCHSKCHLCRRRGFELPGKLFRTTRRSPSSSLSTSPRLTCTARILAVIVKHFKDRP